MVDWLIVFVASPNQQIFPHRPDCAFQSLHHPYIPENEASWKAIPNDEIIFVVIQNEPVKPQEIIPIENNKIPEGLTPLESCFSLSVVVNKEKHKEEELQKNLVESILLNIRTPESSTNVQTHVQCYVKEETGSTRLLGEYQKFFSWSYEDTHGFDPILVQHLMKLARTKQGLVNSTLEEPFRRELRDFLKDGMFFSIHPEWVSNWELASSNIDAIRTCISL
jgi:hypothetical protein